MCCERATRIGLYDGLCAVRRPHVGLYDGLRAVRGPRVDLCDGLCAVRGPHVGANKEAITDAVTKVNTGSINDLMASEHRHHVMHSTKACKRATSCHATRSSDKTGALLAYMHIEAL
eukprot:972301-Pelagomonas_calceolata.AAC.4